MRLGFATPSLAVTSILLACALAALGGCSLQEPVRAVALSASLTEDCQKIKLLADDGYAQRSQQPAVGGPTPGEEKVRNAKDLSVRYDCGLSFP